jgi:sigma-54 dependent transcriptional regulator, acetoin dehydrogenase operon transcriptional activator AcoR
MALRPPFSSGKSASPGITRERLIEIRRRFLAEGIAPTDEVPPVIVRSWMRSRALGLDMDRRPSLESLSHQQLREMRERNEILLRAARGEIEDLHRDAQLTGAIVILTDARGVILATSGNIDFAERASRVSLRPGVQWNEASIGTNAIGTAIAEEGPISVAGAEHFFETHSVLGCSAVPIFDPSGELIGVLDLSNDAGIPQTHTLALVRRAVEQIERRLFEHRFGRHERMHFHTDPDLLNGPHEGLLAFEGPRLVGANRQALDLLGLDWSKLGLLDFEQIFETDREQLAGDGPIESKRIRTLRGAVLFGRMRAGYEDAAPVHRLPRFAPAREMPAAPFDRRLKTLLERAVRLADAGVAILLRGEVGCGKEAFARAIHAASRCGAGPFVAIDCSAGTEAEIEHRLFGDGETTGEGSALTRAAGGSLLFEAVDALPMALQNRMVRELGAGDGAVGGPARERHDFNLLSTTHFALGDRVAAGSFSADFMIRIATHTVDFEPLRLLGDRRALIAETWEGVAPPALVDRLPPETLALLAAYKWPGNRRQLIATLRSLAVLAEAGEALIPEMLPQEIREARGEEAPDAVVALDVEVGLDSITLSAMRTALEAEGGNVSRAARRLGIHRSTLYRRLIGSEHTKT